jgi:hypothetical protein
VTGEHQGDGSFLRKRNEVFFETGQIWPAEAMQGCEGARLEEVSHGDDGLVPLEPRGVLRLLSGGPTARFPPAQSERGPLVSKMINADFVTVVS